MVRLLVAKPRLTFEVPRVRNNSGNESKTALVGMCWWVHGLLLYRWYDLTALACPFFWNSPSRKPALSNYLPLAHGDTRRIHREPLYDLSKEARTILQFDFVSGQNAGLETIQVKSKVFSLFANVQWDRVKTVGWYADASASWSHARNDEISLRSCQKNRLRFSEKGILQLGPTEDLFA